MATGEITIGKEEKDIPAINIKRTFLKGRLVSASITTPSDECAELTWSKNGEMTLLHGRKNDKMHRFVGPIDFFMGDGAYGSGSRKYGLLIRGQKILLIKGNAPFLLDGQIVEAEEIHLAQRDKTDRIEKNKQNDLQEERRVSTENDEVKMYRMAVISALKNCSYIDKLKAIRAVCESGHSEEDKAKVEFVSALFSVRGTRSKE